MQLQLLRQLLQIHDAQRVEQPQLVTPCEVWEHDPTIDVPLREISEDLRRLLFLTAPKTFSERTRIDKHSLNAAMRETRYADFDWATTNWFNQRAAEISDKKLADYENLTPQQRTDELANNVILAGSDKILIEAHYLATGQAILLTNPHSPTTYGLFIENRLRRNARYVSAFLREHHDKVTREWGDHKVFSYTQVVGAGVGRLSGNDVEAALDELVRQGTLRAVPRPAVGPDDTPNPDVTMYQAIEYDCACPSEEPTSTRTGHGIGCPVDIAACRPGEFYATVNRTVASDLAATGLVEIGPLQSDPKTEHGESVFRKVDVQDHRLVE